MVKGVPHFVWGSESYPDMADFHLNQQGPTSPPVFFFNGEMSTKPLYWELFDIEQNWQ